MGGRYKRRVFSKGIAYGVYFIQAESGEIKIGYTKNSARQRLHALQVGSPSRLKLIGTTIEVSEAELHRRFAKHLVHGEWFGPEIENDIRALPGFKEARNCEPEPVKVYFDPSVIRRKV